VTKLKKAEISNKIIKEKRLFLTKHFLVVLEVDSEALAALEELTHMLS
jgi:sorbitol-specific phosphotransferase system component IIA